MPALGQLRNDPFMSPFDIIKDRDRVRKTVFYGRVSTEHEAQLSALENQIQWYDDQAKRHPNWDILDKYIDEGITGTQAKKRPSFLQMLEDAKAGKFDLIVTREVCRFARNTVDTLVTTRQLKNLGIEVYFVEDNIWTMDGDGELRLTIMATLAQEESRKVSERVKAGQHISREQGVVYGCGNILGYDRNVGETYVINEEQAETVRMIYDMYRVQKMGMSKIANELIRLGRLNASGIVKWSSSNVGRVLRNPTYMGYQAYGKSFSNNYLEQKRINNHDASTYLYVKCDFPAIVSEEEWKEVEKIRKEKSRVVENRMYSNPYMGDTKMVVWKNPSKYIWGKLLRCSCGSSFRKDKWHKNQGKPWSFGLQCYKQINEGSARKMIKLGKDPTGYCDTKMIAEWKMDFMAKEILGSIFTDKKVKAIIQNTCDIIETCYQEQYRADADKHAIKREIGKVQAKISNLVDMRTEGDITKEEYRKRRDKLNEEMNQLQQKMNIKTVPTEPELPLDINAIRETLSEMLSFKSAYVDHEIIERFVSRIKVIGYDKYKWIINLSGKEFDEAKDMDSEIQITRVLSFEEARAWRKLSGDYVRNRQWNDIEVDIRII